MITIQPDTHCPLILTDPFYSAINCYHMTLSLLWLSAAGCFAQVLWDLIREQGADEDGDNRISEEEFVRHGALLGFESELKPCEVLRARTLAAF